MTDDELSGSADEAPVLGPLVQPAENGTYAVAFPDHIRELLLWLADQLDEVIETDATELTRLFPTAYANDPEMDAGYQILARGELIDQRKESIAILRATSDHDLVDEAQLNAWMRVVNDLRLVIGTRLDVSENDHVVAEDDPNAGMTEIYHVLGLILSEIVDALTCGLPDPESSGLEA